MSVVLAQLISIIVSNAHQTGLHALNAQQDTNQILEHAQIVKQDFMTPDLIARNAHQLSLTALNAVEYRLVQGALENIQELIAYHAQLDIQVLDAQIVIQAFFHLQEFAAHAQLLVFIVLLALLLQSAMHAVQTIKGLPVAIVHQAILKQLNKLAIFALI